MKIDIWSDIACPYCYIGLKKLQLALAKFSHRSNVELVWHSYELHPSLSMGGSASSYSGYMTRELGLSEDELIADQNQLKQLGEEVGVVFDFARLLLCNTSLALSLVKHASEFNLATEMEEALFEAYFGKGQDVGNKDVLIALGKQIGLEENLVAEFVASNKYLSEVRSDTKHADEVLGLEYIPYYVFNNGDVIQGAIATPEYESLLESSYEEWVTSGVSDKVGEIISGQSCSIDGVCS